MRLATKLKDYYDGAARTTVSDKTHTFIRDQREIEGIETELVTIERWESADREYTLYGELVGFCGVIYPCIRIEVSGKVGSYLPESENNVSYAYNIDEFDKIVPFKEIKNKFWSYGRRRYLYSNGSDNYEELKLWFKSGRTGSGWYRSRDIYEATKDPRLLELFRKDRIAYFHINSELKDKNHIVKVYPLLKDLQFYKVFDAYTCFQTIEHYLVNELIRPDEISEEIQATFTDKLKAQAHGYDEMSFRKEPTKRKK